MGGGGGRGRRREGKVSETRRELRRKNNLVQNGDRTIKLQQWQFNLTEEHMGGDYSVMTHSDCVHLCDSDRFHMRVVPQRECLVRCVCHTHACYVIPADLFFFTIA